MLMKNRDVKGFQQMLAAPPGTVFKGAMKSTAGPVPATLEKVGDRDWELRLRVQDHPGFSWRFDNREAYLWVRSSSL